MGQNLWHPPAQALRRFQGEIHPRLFVDQAHERLPLHRYAQAAVIEQESREYSRRRSIVRRG